MEAAGPFQWTSRASRRMPKDGPNRTWMSSSSETGETRSRASISRPPRRSCIRRRRKSVTLSIDLSKTKSTRTSSRDHTCHLRIFGLRFNLTTVKNDLANHSCRSQPRQVCATPLWLTRQSRQALSRNWPMDSNAPQRMVTCLLQRHRELEKILMLDLGRTHSLRLPLPGKLPPAWSDDVYPLAETTWRGEQRQWLRVGSQPPKKS